jgi:membrane protein implicated in regulation of membrane protease activity
MIFSAVAGVNSLSRGALWLVPSGLTAFMLSLSGAEVWRQVLLFFILTPVLLILSRTFFKKFMKLKTEGSDVIIGRTAIVTEEINNYKATGEIRINGIAHTARAEEDDIIYETGIVVMIVGLEGANAVCSR